MNETKTTTRILITTHKLGEKQHATVDIVSTVHCLLTGTALCTAQERFEGDENGQVSLDEIQFAKEETIKKAEEGAKELE